MLQAGQNAVITLHRVNDFHGELFLALLDKLELLAVVKGVKRHTLAKLYN